MRSDTQGVAGKTAGSRTYYVRADGYSRYDTAGSRIDNTASVSLSVFTHIRSMDDRPPPSRFSSLRSMYGMVPYAVVSLRLFGSEDSIVIVLQLSSCGAGPGGRTL